MDHDKHRLLPYNLWYLSLFLECPPAAFTITLYLFLTRIIEQERQERGRREYKESSLKNIEEGKEKKTSCCHHENPADGSLVMLLFFVVGIMYHLL